MNDQITIGIQLKADGSGLVGQVRLSTAELEKLGKAAARSGKDAERGAKGVDKFGDEAAQSARQAQAFNKRINQTGRELNRLNGLIGGLTFAMVTRSIIQTASAFDGIRYALKGATGSSELARSEFAFLEEQSERLGLHLRSVAGDYIKLTAAAKDTELEGQATRDIFIAVSEAARALHLNVQDTSLVIYALQQMISKGNVSAEELRRQLGEKLPGAFQLAASAMGVTTSELNKMLENGELLATDLLPRLAQALHEKYGEAAMDAAHAADAEFQRFYNTLDKIQDNFGKSGFLSGLAEGLNAVAEALNKPEMQEGIADLGEFVGELLKLSAEDIDWKNILPGVAPYKLFRKYIMGDDGSNDVARVSLPIPPKPGQGDGSGFKGTPPPVKSGPSQETLDAITALEREEEQTYRLLKARQISESTYNRMQAAIEGENLARKLGIDVKSAEGQEIQRLVISIKGLGESLEMVEEKERKRKAVLEDIRREHERLPKTYKESIKALDQWRAEALAALDATKAGYAEFYQQVEEIYAHKIKEAYDKNLDDSREWSAGAIRALRDYADEATNAAANMERVFGNAFSKLEDDLVKGEFNFSNFINSVIEDIGRLAIRENITGPLAGALGGLMGGLGDFLSFGGSSSAYVGPGMSSGFTDVLGYGVGHEGGMVGGPNAFATRFVSPAVFDGAPRYHDGGRIGADEQPIIAKKGEIIGWPEQLRHAFGGGGGSNVIIEDHRSGNAPDLEISRESGFGDDDLIRIIIPAMKEAHEGGHMEGTMARVYGINRNWTPGS